jgi:hypothetical protein
MKGRSKHVKAAFRTMTFCIFLKTALPATSPCSGIETAFFPKTSTLQDLASSMASGQSGSFIFTETTE